MKNTDKFWWLVPPLPNTAEPSCIIHHPTIIYKSLHVHLSCLSAFPWNLKMLDVLTGQAVPVTERIHFSSQYPIIQTILIWQSLIYACLKTTLLQHHKIMKSLTMALVPNTHSVAGVLLMQSRYLANNCTSWYYKIKTERTGNIQVS